MTRLLRIVVLALCLGAVSSSSAFGLSVSGNHLLDEAGQPVRLLGVGRSGSEYACAEGFGFFDGLGIGFRNQLLKLRRHARG